MFGRFLEDNAKSTKLGDLTEVTVREFILYLKEKRRWSECPFVKEDKGGLAQITIQTHIRALRGFFNWMYSEGYTTEHRLARLKPPRVPLKVITILKPEEINKILRCCNKNKASGARNLAIVTLLLDSGLRRTELMKFEETDINIEGGYVKVMGKGSKERVVPFGAVAQKILIRYALHFRPKPINPTVNNFFLSLAGTPMTGNCVKTIFDLLAKKSGVKRFHPHLCRHTFATNYLKNGGDLFSLQQILGHTSLEMVRRYVTLAASDITIQHRKYSPMDRINLGR
jgi:site-specific recombinase XerD